MYLNRMEAISLLFRVGGAFAAFGLYTTIGLTGRCPKSLGSQHVSENRYNAVLKQSRKERLYNVEGAQREASLRGSFDSLASDGIPGCTEDNRYLKLFNHISLLYN